MSGGTADNRQVKGAARRGSAKRSGAPIGGADALDDARAQTAAQIADLASEWDAVVAAAAADAPDDEHDAEGATVGYERARVSALLWRAREHLAALERAAQRREAGTYEICARCAGPIGAERLAALPATDRCVACATAPLHPR